MGCREATKQYSHDDSGSQRGNIAVELEVEGASVNRHEVGGTCKWLIYVCVLRRLKEQTR